MSLARKVETEAVRGLELLRLIDATIENVTGISEAFDSVRVGAHAMAARVGNSAHDAEIDPEDKLVARFREVQNALCGMKATFQRRLQAAEVADELDDDDGVADAYRLALGSLDGAFEALEDLVWAIQTNDGIASGTDGQVYGDVESLIASLR